MMLSPDLSKNTMINLIIACLIRLTATFSLSCSQEILYIKPNYLCIPSLTAITSNLQKIHIVALEYERPVLKAYHYFHRVLYENIQLSSNKRV